MKKIIDAILYTDKTPLFVALVVFVMFVVFSFLKVSVEFINYVIWGITA